MMRVVQVWRRELLRIHGIFTCNTAGDDYAFKNINYLLFSSSAASIKM